MKNADKPAYPGSNARTDQSFVNQSPWELNEGLTKREMFAMVAMQGICSTWPGDKYHVNGGWLHPATVAKNAIDIADELLKQLEPENK